MIILLIISLRIKAYDIHIQSTYRTGSATSLQGRGKTYRSKGSIISVKSWHSFEAQFANIDSLLDNVTNYVRWDHTIIGHICARLRSSITRMNPTKIFKLLPYETEVIWYKSAEFLQRIVLNLENIVTIAKSSSFEIQQSNLMLYTLLIQQNSFSVSFTSN